MASMDQWFWSADKTRGPRVWVIAEIGVNHNGRVSRAVELVDAAAKAGVDAVKVQVFDPQRLVSAQAVAAAYQGGAGTDPRQLLEQLTLDDKQLEAVRDAARSAGLAFVATPFSLTDVDRLNRLKVDAVKIASTDAVNMPLIERSLPLDRPILISTGTCDLDELRPAADLLHSHESGGALLQCVSAYPITMDQAALGGITALAEAFNLPVGYSDHTTRVHTGALAVAAGAVVVEKHLTYDKAAPGPDHAASLTGEELNDYARHVHEAAAALGPSVKRKLDVEKDVQDVSRQSLCVTADLPAGRALTHHDLTIKRPGTGLPPNQLEKVIGQRLTRSIKADHLLRAEHLESPRITRSSID